MRPFFSSKYAVHRAISPAAAYASGRAPGGIHQLPLQLSQNYAVLRRQLEGSRDALSVVKGSLPPVPISVSNALGLANLGLLAVGSSETNYVVDFDIFRSDSLIIDKAAGGEYDYRNSYSFRNLSTPVHYGIDTSGYWATETFKIPLTVLGSVKQPFVWINYHNRGFIDFFFSSLGLGMPVNSNSFLHRIKHWLQKPLFSLYFEPIDVWSGIPQPVSLTFGGIDSHCRRRPIFYTDYVNISLFNSSPWTFRVKAVTIPSGANDTEELSIRVNAPTCIVTFPFILGPRKYIKRIAHRLGARASQEEDFENPIDCAKRRSGPTVFLHVGGKALKLTAEDYIIKMRNGPNNNTSITYSCYLAFQSHAFFGITSGDTWCVGTPLFNSNCLVLDFGKKRIGFATPKKVWEV